jgi:hypothetical protein
MTILLLIVFALFAWAFVVVFFNTLGRRKH